MYQKHICDQLLNSVNEYNFLVVFIETILPKVKNLWQIIKLT